MAFLYDTEKLEPLARKLSRMATRAYTKHDDGHHTPRLDLPADAQKGPNFGDLLPEFLESPPTTTEAKRLSNSLKSDGFTGFTYLASGQDGDVFVGNHLNGHDYALRIARYPSAREFRPISPMVLQPFKTYITNWDHVLEVSPLVQILTQPHTIPAANTVNTRLNEADGKTLTQLMSQAAMAAGQYCTQMVVKDLAILPNGTPIQPDPGQIQYIDAHMHLKPDLIKQGLSMMFNATYARPMPEQFRWFTPQGKFAQDNFFKSPYAKTAYYQGFTSS